jgi:hypothetical protein
VVIYPLPSLVLCVTCAVHFAGSSMDSSAADSDPDPDAYIGESVGMESGGTTAASMILLLAPRLSC